MSNYTTTKSVTSEWPAGWSSPSGTDESLKKLLGALVSECFQHNVLNTVSSFYSYNV